MTTLEIHGPDAAYTWTLSGRGPMTALQQDVQRAYAEASRVCFETSGSMMAREHVLTFVDGFAYRRAPTVDAQEVDRRQQSHRDRAQRHADAGTTYYEAELRPEVEAIVRRLRRHPRPGAPLRRLVDHLAETIDAYAHVMGDLHWRMVGTGGMDWPTEFHAITGQAPVESSVLVGGVENTSTRLVRRLCALARAAREDPQLEASVEVRDPSRLAELPDGPAVRRFRSLFTKLLRDYGLRTGAGWGSSIGFSPPTWNLRPDVPLGMVATYLRADIEAIERAEAQARRARANAVRRIRRQLSTDLERLERFDKSRSLALTMARLMEDHNHLMDNCSVGVMSEAIALVGQRLVTDGLLDDPAEVQHLGLDDLRALASGELGTDVRALVAERSRLQQERSNLQPPPRLGADSDAPAPSFGETQGEGLHGTTLKGVGASRGRYTGRARVAEASPVPPDVEQGEVLVATDAGPAWTPVFPLLGALVLDRGAAFQHAAVMAREYGIPAVLGTREATSAITDGQTVTVDGSAGLVELDAKQT